MRNPFALFARLQFLVAIAALHRTMSVRPSVCPSFRLSVGNQRVSKLYIKGVSKRTPRFGFVHSSDNNAAILKVLYVLQ